MLDLLYAAETLLVLGVLGVLVIWPLVRTAVDERWGWVAVVVLTGPVGGLLWFALGRRRPGGR
jgi:hypothetical protein